MRNNHTIKAEIECKCPFEACGKIFFRRIKIRYVTNQRGDVIEEKVT